MELHIILKVLLNPLRISTVLERKLLSMRMQVILITYL